MKRSPATLESALLTVRILLESEPGFDDIDREIKRLTTYRCPECGSTNTSQPDDEKLVDCYDCGIWFDPFHPHNRHALTGEKEGTLCQACGKPTIQPSDREIATNPQRGDQRLYLCKTCAYAANTGGRRWWLKYNNSGRSGMVEGKEEPWIGVDLDGTLAKYTTWKGSDKIGKPIEPMAKRVRNWVKHGKTVKIFTARADDEKSVIAIRKWLKANDLPDLEVTNLKDHSMEELWDDKAVAVEKNTGEVKEGLDPETPEEIKRYALKHGKGPPRKSITHIETESDYKEFQRRFSDFMEREGINSLSSDAEDEGGFSWSRCDCCRRNLGGDRVKATGYNPTTREIQEYDICRDCEYYAEYGQLDDQTMLDLKPD